LASGGKLFGLKVVKVMKLDEWEEAIHQAKELASEGKVILDCQK